MIYNSQPIPFKIESFFRESSSNTKYQDDREWKKQT